MTWLHQVDPIALRLPEFELFGRAFAPTVHWYGVMYAIGFGLAWYLGRRRIAQGRLPGVDANGFADLLFYGMIGVYLVADGFEMHIPKGYIYGAMGFSALVEVLNLWAKRRARLRGRLE